DAGPAGGALLNPDDPRPARLGQALGLADHSQQTLGTGRHGLQLFAARGLVEAADDTVLIVIIDTQDDILGHGGLPKVSGFSAGSPNAYPRPSSGEFNRPAGGETAFPHAIFGVGTRLRDAMMRHTKLIVPALLALLAPNPCRADGEPAQTPLFVAG